MAKLTFYINNMKKNLFLFFLIIPVGVIIWVIMESLSDSSVLINSTANQNNINSENLTTDQQLIELRHGFSFKLPAGWEVVTKGVSSINIVKYGSPTDSVFIAPHEAIREIYTSSGISADSFTIDERLSAKDAANLIHDLHIADKIDEGTVQCYFPSQVEVTLPFEYYAFRSDNSDLSRCVSEGTEIGISETFIFKKIGDERAMVITYSANPKLFSENLFDFEQVLSSITIED
ncbi:hypothetical protein KKC06_02460 [Patescibacteria group bacterium]|nr:hypothetical protein [Patescibacteria group bacterium]